MMSYYTYILEQYNISDCKTFEEVKKKFPHKSSAFLRKVIYLKGLRITKNGKLMPIALPRRYNYLYSKEKVTERSPVYNKTVLKSEKMKISGRFLEITVLEVVKNWELRCPIDCVEYNTPRTCGFGLKRDLMIKPDKKKLVCTIAIIKAKKTSTQKITCIHPKKSRLIDSLGDSFFGLNTDHIWCETISKIIGTIYGKIQLYETPISYNTEVTFLFLYPQLPLKAEPVKLIIETYTYKGLTRNLVETFEFEIKKRSPSRKPIAPSAVIEYKKSLPQMKPWRKLKPELTMDQKQERFLETPTEKLSEEIVTYVKERSIRYPFDDRRLRAAISKFWTKRHPYTLNNRAGSLPSNIKFKRDKAESLAYQKILKSRKQYLDSLTQKLNNWALEKNLRRITRVDVKLFLMEHSTRLPVLAENMLYRQAKLQYRYLGIQKLRRLSYLKKLRKIKRDIPLKRSKVSIENK